MSEFESWKILFLLTNLSFLFGVFYIRNSARKIATSRIITMMLIGYSILTVGFFSLIYTTFIRVEFLSSNLLGLTIKYPESINHMVFDKWGFCIDLLSIFAISITIFVFLSSVIISQISLRYLTKTLNDCSDFTKAKELKSKFPWLKNINLLVIDLESPEAFSMTLLKIKIPFKIKIEDLIVVSSGLIDLMNDHELEAILAHEYSHIIFHDTRYSHLIYTLRSFLFFDPIYRMVVRYMNSKHEIDADMNAVKMVPKPKSLASALFKLLDFDYVAQKSFSPGFKSKSMKLMARRIELLLSYARVNQYSI